MRPTYLVLVGAILFPCLAQQPPAQKKAAEQPAKPAAPTPPAAPKDIRQQNYVYDLNGRPVPSPGADERRQTSGAETILDRQESRRDATGRPVTVRSSEERMSGDKEGSGSGERVIQRYDLNGKPTSKQVMKFERRKQPDGSVVSTETLYEQDVNGRMQFVERRTTNEKKTASGSTTGTVVERPSLSGGLQVVERNDSTETKRSESVTETVTSRKLLDANGRLAEREREASIATKSGSLTSTETKQWQLGATGKMDLVERRLSRATEAPGGNETEDVEVYTTRVAGTTPDLNLPQVPTLEQKVHREKKVQPDGKIVETTSARLRQVADPSRLGGLMVTEQVTTPTPDGRTIQRTVSERDANGKLARVRTEIEEEKK